MIFVLILQTFRNIFFNLRTCSFPTSSCIISEYESVAEAPAGREQRKHQQRGRGPDQELSHRLHFSTERHRQKSNPEADRKRLALGRRGVFPSWIAQQRRRAGRLVLERIEGQRQQQCQLD